MARYIDADKLVEKYERAMKDVWNKKTRPLSWNEAYDCVITDIVDEPTADVVPKSEVERLNAVMKDMDEQRAYTINMLGENLENAKSEVERLQAEIETLKDNNEHLAVLLEEAKQAYANYEETTGLKQAKQEVAREIFADFKLKAPFFCENQIAYDHFNEELAELKQKYTGEKT